MKKLVAVCALVAVCMVPSLGMAAEQVGVYVAPKFVFGIADMQKFRGMNSSESGGPETEKMGSDTDNAYGGSLAIGYDFSKRFDIPIRAELEYAGFSKFEIKHSERDEDWAGRDKQTFSVQTLFLNAYWDINTGTMITPYIGAGMGMGFINTKWKGSGWDPADREGTYMGKSSASKTVSNFAWNVGAGVGVDLTEAWTVDVGYRFVGLGEVKTKTKSFDFEGERMTMSTKVKDLYMHQISAGLRYTF